MFCPMFTLKEINHLEKKFLELIEYDVSVSTSLYASYYFQLRTLCQRENNGQEPALKPMDMEKAQALEARGLSKTAELKKSAGKTWQSANDVDSSAMGGLGSLSPRCAALSSRRALPGQSTREWPMLSRLALGEPKGRNAHPAAVLLESAVGATSLCLSLSRAFRVLCVCRRWHNV